MVINRVGPASCAKMAGLLYMILGLVMGAIFAFIALIGGFNHGRPGAGPVFGMAAVVLFPIFYGLLGFVMTLIMSWLYNTLAGLVGGVEIDVR